MTMVREGNKQEVEAVPNGHTPVSDIQVNLISMGLISIPETFAYNYN